MKFTVLIAGVATAALVTGAAQATTHHKTAKAQNAGAYNEPSQPVAYGSVNAYLKASPKQRAGRDWSGATTGASVNTSAAMPNPTANAAPSTGAADTGAASASTMANQPPGTAATPPTIAPDVGNAASQPPLNQGPASTNAQPPASNAPVTTEQPQ